MRRLRSLLRLSADDSAFTLVELLIYCLLMAAIVAVAGSILITSLRGQSDIANSANGNNNGQLISQSISGGIQSATYIRVTTISATSQLLVVANPGLGATPSTRCEAWYFTTDNGGAVYTLTSSSDILVPTLTALTTQWRLLATGIGKSTRSGAPSAMLTTSGIPVTSVSYEFTMADGSGRPILISSSATSRQAIALLGSTLCI